jgi:hypothetical protein
VSLIFVIILISIRAGQVVDLMPFIEQTRSLSMAKQIDLNNINTTDLEEINILDTINQKVSNINMKFEKLCKIQQCGDNQDDLSQFVEFSQSTVGSDRILSGFDTSISLNVQQMLKGTDFEIKLDLNKLKNYTAG